MSEVIRKKMQVEIISEIASLSNLRPTDVPAVIGIVMSKTMILAVKIVASDTTDVGSHKTLPTFR